MTFCIGIRVNGGLIALADTEIVKGDERLNKSKVAVNANQNAYWWVMTSGLRSVRDKTLVYLHEDAGSQYASPFTRLYEVANAFGQQLRRVRGEDGPALAQSNLVFNVHAIIGGQLTADRAPCMYYVYPEGNWIESNNDSPYFIIGRTPYAKPILDRLLNVDTGLPQALAIAFLAFDATRTSVIDVGFPIDVIVSATSAQSVKQARFDSTELSAATAWWHSSLRAALSNFPFEHFNKVIPDNLDNVPNKSP